MNFLIIDLLQAFLMIPQICNNFYHKMTHFAYIRFDVAMCHLDFSIHFEILSTASRIVTTSVGILDVLNHE
jgi:hypothetical protein